MPPKPKLHQDKGKLRVLPKPSTSSAPNVVPSPGLDEDAQQQFEVELYWCIQQLQNSLASNKLNNKQAEDTTKYLKDLTSKKTSIVQKRQVMRHCLGDYRKKMKDEEKKFKKVNEKASIQVGVSSKSTFVKKSAVLQSNPNFKFNFDEPKQSNDIIEKDLEKLDIKSENFHFTPSQNTFRFNFVE